VFLLLASLSTECSVVRTEGETRGKVGVAKEVAND
jgi:hypothetical protein